MKLKNFIISTITTLVMLSCSDAVHTGLSSESAETEENLNADPANVLKDAGTWYNYNRRNIKLTENYTLLDTASNPIDREKFLQSLSSGNYVAFRLTTSDSSFRYKLYRLDSTVDKGVGLQVKQFGKDELKRYRMEGTEIPDFNFTDVNGKVYNKETTKGKVVIIKCWFIHCQACVEEMPALNAIVKYYKNRDDVLFLSLAFDTKEALKAFLTKTEFDYAVIPVDYEYLEKKLKVNEYPTQFIVGKNGKIAKIVTYYQDMVSVLKKELSK